MPHGYHLELSVRPGGARKDCHCVHGTLPEIQRAIDLDFWDDFEHGFGLLYRNDWCDYQYEVTKDAQRRENSRLSFHQERMQALKEREEELDETAKAIRKAIASRDKEIERLRLREKYLSEGKPQLLESSPSKPNLDDFL